MNTKNNNNSNEQQIRKIALKMFLENYSSKEQEKLVIVEEFNSGRMITRTDITILDPNNKLFFFEIKSNKDSLKRLELQIVDYRKYSNSILLFLDISLLKEFKKFLTTNTKIAKYISKKNVYFFSEKDNNNEELYSFFDLEKDTIIPLTKLKKESFQPTKELELDIFFLLWHEERKEFLNKINFEEKKMEELKDKNIEYLTKKVIFEKLTVNIIIKYSFNILYNRMFYLINIRKNRNKINTVEENIEEIEFLGGKITIK
jgi:hypothetical protein